jgi:lipase
VLLQLHEWGDPSAPPVICVHGLNAHGRRFRKLAEESLASHFRVLAPDLRGHGGSDWEPPWTIATHVHDLLETLDDASVRKADWIGHSFGARLVLELAALDPARIRRAVLLDPAIQLLPHVGFDFAERERADRAYDTPEQAIDERLASGVPTPREFLEEENREHLVHHRDGKFRFRYCQAAVVSMYGELCTPPPAPETLRMPALLVHAGQFGLVRKDQLEEYERALGNGIRVVEVPGGHIVYWDAFAETAEAVQAFLLEDPGAEA